MDDTRIGFEARLEDPHKLAEISRRGFIGGVAGLAGTALFGAPGDGLAAATNAPASLPRPAKPDDEAYWRWVADQFLLRDGIAYMNTGTRGPSPRNVYEAQVESIRAFNTDRLSYARYEHNPAFRDGLRQKMADFLGCKPSEVAFTNNTTEGMVFGTNGPVLERGDEIVCTNHDHSSGAQPIHLRAAREKLDVTMVDLSGADFHPAKSPSAIVDAFDAAISRKTKLISFCHVNYTDGCVMPVKEICELARSKDVLTLVDGAHPPGMMDLDLHALGCDMYAGACHKWMLAGMLTGFFYVREELQDRIWPTVYSGPVNGLNMYGAKIGEQFADRVNTAARYEIHGSGNYAATKSVDAALDFHNAITPKAIEARDRYLAKRAREGLSGIDGVRLYCSEDPRLSCGLVSFSVRGIEPRELSEMLWDRHQIYIRNVSHPEIDWDANRASLHIMVTSADVDRLVDAVAEAAKEVVG